MLSTSEEFSGFGPDDIDFSVVQAPVPLADQGKEGMDFSRKGKVRAMDEEMIETIVDAYGQSALRAKECGFDMVQVHAGHGWLIHQFLSPLTNHRTDRFGGSTENRGRFLKMVIERIRQYCGEDLLIEMRMSGSDNTEGGYDVHEAVEFAKMVEDDVDIIHVSTGNFYYPDTDVDMIPTVFTEWGHNIYLAKEMKKHITKAKIATVGAIMEPSFMEKTLAEGSADLVVVGRALVADPELPNKARRGQEQEIRPCLRCCFCLSDYQSRWLHCTVNPTIYRPYETLYMNPPASKKKVLIAGGGVAGMQAAVTAAERGHEVILCEKTDRLGGLIRYARSVDFKYDTRRYLDHMIAKVYRRGVDVRLLCEVTPELIEEIKPDHVIAAVGSTHIVPNIPGCERAIPIMEYLSLIHISCGSARRSWGFGCCGWTEACFSGIKTEMTSCGTSCRTSWPCICSCTFIWTTCLLYTSIWSRSCSGCSCWETLCTTSWVSPWPLPLRTTGPSASISARSRSFLKPMSYYALTRVTVDAEACVSCGRCKKVCPMNVDMTDNSRKRKNGTECILCLECVDSCPKGALKL